MVLFKRRRSHDPILSILKSIDKACKSAQQAEKRRSRYIAKCGREAEAARRRSLRDMEKARRDQARRAKELDKLQKQLQFEAEVRSINEENEIWSSFYKGVSTLVSESELEEAIANAESEKMDLQKCGLFEKSMPEKTAYEQLAMEESNSKYDTDSLTKTIQEKKDWLCTTHFDSIEPTEESIAYELKTEAKSKIKVFWPWKKVRLVKEYVKENLSARFLECHSKWLSDKVDFESNVNSVQEEVLRLENEMQSMSQQKTLFLEKRAEQLYDNAFSEWKTDRDKFYDDCLENLRGILEGKCSFVEAAFAEALSDNDLPMVYYVQPSYDETTFTIKLDVDLPEIEDIPQQKAVLTAAGKQSIKNKTVKELNEDYVQCICGLAIFLAEDMFNISPKIQKIEVAGFTQRPDAKTSLITDQYVYVVEFDRDTFQRVNFKRFSAFQAFSFFKHYINATKTMSLKEIDLPTAIIKLEQNEPVNYIEYLSHYSSSIL